MSDPGAGRRCSHDITVAEDRRRWWIVYTYLLNYRKSGQVQQLESLIHGEFLLRLSRAQKGDAELWRRAHWGCSYGRMMLVCAGCEAAKSPICCTSMLIGPNPNG